MAAISTYQCYLMHQKAEETELSKLIDIKDFPDLQGKPQKIDTTT